MLDSAGSADIVVVNPARYSFNVLSGANTFSFRADCNTGSGELSVTGNEIEFQSLLEITQAMCGRDSLDKTFLRLLGESKTFDRIGNRLIIVLRDNAGEMLFEAQQ